MLPAINPPTDNLYKFISLFGLTIFLFALYNLGIITDQVTRSKMQFEDIKTEVQQRIYSESLKQEPEMVRHDVSHKFRSLFIGQLQKEVKKVESFVHQSVLPLLQKIALRGKLHKISVDLDHKQSKEIWCWIFIITGFISMITGFALWFRKEQSIRDSLLRQEQFASLNQTETPEESNASKSVMVKNE